MSENKATLVVLAAGMGSRYGGLKQLDPVGPAGEAILDYSVYDAMKSGFNKVVFIIREDFKDLFVEKVAKKYKNYIDCDFVFQKIEDLPGGFDVPQDRTKPWGTVHALLATKNVINTPFAVINADDFYGRDAYETLFKYLTSPEMKANCQSKFPINSAMVGFKLANTLSDNGSVARGICKKDSNGYLTKVDELTKIYKTKNGAENIENGVSTKLSGQEPVSMNMWAFSPRILNEFEFNFQNWLKENIKIEKSECFIPVEIDNMIRSGKTVVKVLPTSSVWFGVTYKQDKPDVEAKIRKLIDEGLYPDPLFKA